MTCLRCYFWLFIAAILLGAFNSAYVVLGLMPSMMAEFINAYMLPICFATWVQADARRRQCTPCFDFGMFVAMVWIIVVPWYLMRTRGWRGLLLSLMFLGLLVTPYLIPVIVYMVLVSLG